MAQNIDIIPTSKSIIDFQALPKNSFNSEFMGYDLSKVLDEVILAEFVDETGTGEMIRGGIIVQTNAATNAWRIGKVILIGNNVKLAKVGDYIMFPNNLGIPIANITVKNYGKVTKGVFVSENRIFGVVEPGKGEETVASVIGQS